MSETEKKKLLYFPQPKYVTLVVKDQRWASAFYIYMKGPTF